MDGAAGLGMYASSECRWCGGVRNLYLCTRFVYEYVFCFFVCFAERPGYSQVGMPSLVVSQRLNHNLCFKRGKMLVAAALS